MKENLDSLDELANINHDSLFKMFFNQSEVVKEHVRFFLPKAIVDEIDFNHFAKDDTAYISHYFKKSFADSV